MTTIIARETTKLVVPLMLLVSFNFFLQGHNLPGGGFIAGVMTSAAIALLYIIFNFDGIAKIQGKEKRIRHSMTPTYNRLSGVGVLLAIGTGLITITLGLNFLNHRKGNLHTIIFGNIHWTTAVIFDLGVYLAVVGSLLTMIEVLGEE